jgi:hypothetical protein
VVERHGDDALAIKAAGKAVAEIRFHGRDQGNLAKAKESFDQLCAIAGTRPDNSDIRKRLLNGTMQLTACYAKCGNLADMGSLGDTLRRFTKACPSDPTLYAGLAEIAAAMMIQAALDGDQDGTRSAYSEITAITKAYGDQPHILATYARATANMVAYAAESGHVAEAHRLVRRLAQLSKRRIASARVRHHRAEGLFNLIAHEAAHGEVPASLELYQEMTEFAELHPRDRDLSTTLADAAFAVITVLGNRRMPAIAEEVYEDIRTRVMPHAATIEAKRSLACAAFNLITDFCRVEEVSRARELYEDILGLSVDTDDDAIALTLAKAGVNIILACEWAGRSEMADCVHEDLLALVSARPELRDIQDTIERLSEVFDELEPDEVDTVEIERPGDSGGHPI